MDRIYCPVRLCKFSASPRPTNTEIVRLRRVSRGDRDAFWELWLQHRQYLYECCSKGLSGDRSRVQLAMSVLLQQSWQRLPSRANQIVDLRGWLTRLASKTCSRLQRESVTSESSARASVLAPNRPERVADRRLRIELAGAIWHRNAERGTPSSGGGRL